MIFVDTNFFLRFLLADVRSQYLEAQKLLFQASRGEKRLISSTLVFFEIYWVSKSYYQKSKTELIDLLQKILDLSYVILEERSILQKSLNSFKQTSLSLEDCYNLQFAKEKNVEEFKTFDIQLTKKFSTL